MKKSFAIFLALIAFSAFGQTFKVQNLQVLGNATIATPLAITYGGTGASTQGAALTAILGSSTVPIANGGTGASTQPTALTAILGSSAVPIANGGTGATTQPAALTAILGSSTVPIANGGTNSTTATGATSNLQYLQGATGSVARSVTSKLQDIVDTRDFNVTCNGSGDDTSKIQSALNTGANVHIQAGTCIITNALTVSTKGQIIRGDGKAVTILQVPATFNLSALGVFVASSGEEGPQFRDFKVAFVQPDTSVRANLVAYPPAFYLQSTPRFTMRDIFISQAITGIDMRGNSGGAFIDTVEMSMYTTGITIDGSLDSVRISKLHVWPFDLTTNQQVIYNDGTSVGILSARMDDLHIDDGLFFSIRSAVKLIQGGGGPTFAHITNTDFDNYGGLVVQAGVVDVSASFFSIGDTASMAILQSGGFVKCAACEFSSIVAATNPIIKILESDGLTGYAQITGSMFDISTDMPVISVGQTSGAASLVLVGNQFKLPANTSQTNPVIAVTAQGRLTAIGNRISDKGTGTGTFISVAADDQHILEGNACVGWGFTLPGSYTSLASLGNTACTGSNSNNVLGNLSASGSFSGTTITGTSLTGTSLTLSGAIGVGGIIAATDTSANGMNIKLTGDGGTTPIKYIRVNGGNFQVVNSAYSGTPMTMDDAGNVQFTGSLSHAAQEIDKSYTFNTPTTGQTVTLATGTETALIVPAGTLATLTITLPGCTSGYDGSLARFSSSQAITVLTVNATSGTVVDAPNSLGLGGGNGYLCRGANTSWYRLY